MKETTEQLKHTPGPWKFDEESGNYCFACNDERTDYTFRVEPGEFSDSEEMTANANLIASAPETAAERDKLKQVNHELLKALKLIRGNRDHCAELGQYMDGTVTGDQCFDDWAADVADSAIAKATTANS